MNNCIKSMKLFPKALYGELAGEEKKWFSLHLEDCERCTSEYNKMAATLNIMNERKLPHPEDSYWEEYSRILYRKIDVLGRQEGYFSRVKDRFIEIMAFQPRLVYAPALVLVLIILSLTAGKNFYSVPQDTTDTVLAEARSADPYLVNTTMDSYLERSKVILTTISNFDPVEDDVYTLDIPGQKDLSRKLLRDAEMLQSAPEIRDSRELLKLVYDLQMIMLKIVEMDEMTDEFEIDLLKLSIRNSALLFKINIEQIKKRTDERNSKTGRETGGKRIVS